MNLYEDRPGVTRLTHEQKVERLLTQVLDRVTLLLFLLALGVGLILGFELD